jgi:ferritin
MEGLTMITKKIEKAINEQLNRELYSAYLYLAMSADATAKGYKGAGKWFRVQFQEEQGHALKFYDYLQSQGAGVVLNEIKKPKGTWKSLLEMFESTLKHEQFITKSLNELMDLAVAGKDYATQSLVQWYITEQIEEEANDVDILSMLRMAGSSTGTQLMIDKQLGKRGAAS